MVDTQILKIGNTYINSFGEEYTIRNFKYYISRISLKNNHGENLFAGSHLINEADTASKQITISTSDTGFVSISFLIGVDSIYNFSGTQAGDLDPAKGMFWTWNSGYITAKLEATSPLSQQPNNNATYHIGGFRHGQNTTRTITLQLPARELATTTKLTREITIEANANKWFNAVHSLKISENPVCTTPGNLAVQFADNYAQMFTIAPVR